MAAATTASTNGGGPGANLGSGNSGSATPTGNANPNNAVPPPPSLLSESTAPSNLTVSHLATLSSRLFLSHLSSIPSSKTLLLDPTLAGPLGLVIDTNSLKNVGVERMFWMEEGGPQDGNSKKNVNAPTKAVVYVCRPKEKWINVIKSHINYDVSTSAGGSSASTSNLAHAYHALLTPHRTELSLLSLSSVLPHLNILDFGMELVPLEPDLLSSEEEGAAWSDLYLTGDQTVLHRSAMILMTCQMLWGCFPRITGKGDLSRRLADLLVRQRREHLASDPTNPSLTALSRVVDGLVIVERGTDMATPMCNQLTYTGLLDETVGVKSSHIEVDPALLSGQQSQSAQQSLSTPSGSSTPLVTPSPHRALKKHRLDAANDALYEQIRDLNFSTVGSVLHGFAKKLSTSYEDRHSAKTVSEMRAFVGKLGGLQGEHTSLRLHTALTEKIMVETNSELFNRSLEIQQNIVAGLDLNGQLTAIEDIINLEAPLNTVLRLLCLLSTTQGGLKAKNFEQIKRDICHTYGYEHVITLLNLEKAGLLTRTKATVDVRSGPASVLSPFASSAAATATSSGSTTSSSAFERVRQPLRLINDDVSESDPTDVAYVYSGYAPLSIRIIQAVGQKEALVGTSSTSAGRSQQDSQSTSNPSSSNRHRKPRAHPLVGWKGFEDVLGAIPGETFDFIQRTRMSSSTNGGEEQEEKSTNEPWSNDPDRKRTTVVFFLGGITYAEIAAIRFMSRQSRNRTWLIITTGIITGNKILDMAMNGGTL
ncbi:unnamed protein product [Sympodiomycopsis kandeliae]